MLRAFIFFILASVTIAAQEPRPIAEEGLAAWRAGDAKRLDAVAHAELKRRCRNARIVEYYIEDSADKKKILASGSDAEVMALFCEALRSIVLRDERVEYFDRYIDTIQKKDYAIVVFDSGWRQKKNPEISRSSRVEVVLKKVGDTWRFLWSPSAQLHVDLEWDAREERAEPVARANAHGSQVLQFNACPLRVAHL